MNTPVSFEIAKLLTHTYFNQKSAGEGYVISTGELSSDYFMDLLNAKAIAAPTIAEVVMWLYEKHNIWISVSNAGNFGYLIQYLLVDGGSTIESIYESGTPAEAYTAAIEYTLTKLI